MSGRRGSAARTHINFRRALTCASSVSSEDTSASSRKWKSSSARSNCDCGIPGASVSSIKVGP